MKRSTGHEKGPAMGNEGFVDGDRICWQLVSEIAEREGRETLPLV
jgi:hypothetical protein